MFRPFWVGIQITFHYLLGWLLGGKGRYKLPSMMHVKFPSTENNTCVSFGSTPPTQDASRHQESYMFKTGNPYVFKPLHLATPDVSLKKSCQKRIGTVLHRRDFFFHVTWRCLNPCLFLLVFCTFPQRCPEVPRLPIRHPPHLCTKGFRIDDFIGSVVHDLRSGPGPREPPERLEDEKDVWTKSKTQNRTPCSSMTWSTCIYHQKIQLYWMHTCR